MDGSTREVAPLLEIEDLAVEVDGTEVLSRVNLVVGEGEVHVLLGPNGQGKTTLLNTVMGLPGYQVTRGNIRFKGQDMAGLEIDERARLGLGMAFQRPPAVRGIRLEQLLEVASGGELGTDQLTDLSARLALMRLLHRDVNMGFSGGEMKRSEMAQLLAQQPDLALFDEPESGVDLDNIAVVGEAMNTLLKPGPAQRNKRAGLIVTHTGHILHYVNADIGHVLLDGQLACQGNPLDLIADIEENGYQKCAECPAC
jgi:Fe-S cluster assembly ATP-binding protein